MDEETEKIEKKLVEVYNDGGSSAVMDYVRKVYPHWGWCFCPDCDEVTPVFDNVCAVCFYAHDLNDELDDSYDDRKVRKNAFGQILRDDAEWLPGDYYDYE